MTRTDDVHVKILHQPPSYTLLVTLLIVLCTPLPAETGNNQISQRPLFHFTAASPAPIIEFNLVHHMLTQQDPIPLLRIYGDGRVHVHIPAYMKRAGDYQMHLSGGQLDDLLLQLANKGIMDFDPAAVELQKHQLATARRAAGEELRHISDATDTLITVKLAQYQRNATGPLISGFNKQFRWRNLEFDAKNLPGSAALGNAADAQTILRGLCAHPALQKMP